MFINIQLVIHAIKRRKTTASHRRSHERMMTKNDLHVVVEPFEVQNNITEATIGTETYIALN